MNRARATTPNPTNRPCLPSPVEAGATYNMKHSLDTPEVAKILLQDKNADWTYKGAYALALWLCELDDECGTDTEMDRVAIRCDFSEWGSAMEAASEYSFEPDVDQTGLSVEETTEEIEKSALEWLQDRTTTIPFDGGVIIQCF